MSDVRCVTYSKKANPSVEKKNREHFISYNEIYIYANINIRISIQRSQPQLTKSKAKKRTSYIS